MTLAAGTKLGRYEIRSQLQLSVATLVHLTHSARSAFRNGALWKAA